MSAIVINMESQKKFWKKFPIEIILDEQRRQRERESQQEQLRIPLYPAPEIYKEKEDEKEDTIIINFF